MYTVTKIGTIILGLLGTILCIILMFGMFGIDVNNDNFAMGGLFGINYFLLFIAVLVIISSAVISMIASPKSVKKVLFSIGGIIAIMLVSYIIANAISVKGDGSLEIKVSAGIIASYILVGLSIISVFGALIKNFLMK